MPIRAGSNNRILPANARASDVASKAVQEFLAAEQSRNYSAFRVQGYEGLLYNRMMQGPKCTCQATERQLASRLDIDGKASPGMINQMLTGEMTFTVSGYGASPKSQQEYNPLDALTSPRAPANKNQGQFDIYSADDSEFMPLHKFNESAFGDNGPVEPESIDDMVQDFDAGRMGMTDAHCHICYGTGFVGGYVPFNAHRVVLPINVMDLDLAEIDLTQRPWTSDVEEVTATITLPRYVLGLDCIRLMNGGKQVQAQFFLDGMPCDTMKLLRACDGRPHVLAAKTVNGKRHTVTHLELQLITSNQSPYFELPKLTKGSDTAKLEQLEPFTILLSANVPSVRSQDIIVERVFGKTLYVTDSNWHNTRNRNVIGWECQVRVLQPQEIYTMLPKRGRTLTKPPTSLMQHDNGRGNRRT